MTLALVIWSLLAGIFVGVPATYFFYMRRLSFRSWNLDCKIVYSPKISVIVPVHNEERIIDLKLENLAKINYPAEKLQIIVANDASNDGTIQKVAKFQQANQQLEILVSNNTGERGKTNSMNLALNHASGEIVVVSDADCFWPPEILIKVLPYLSDPLVGAVTGLEKLLNPGDTWVTKSEALYNNTYQVIQIGESKFHSTIIFQGGFGAFKRTELHRFSGEADDSGTALDLVQKGVRTLLVPELVYFTAFPRTYEGKLAIKLRRATVLARVWSKCMKLFFRGKIVLPKRIFLPETYLYLLNPFVFLSLLVVSAFVVLENPIFLCFLLGLVAVIIASRKLRTLFIETFQDQIILLGAIFGSLFRRKSTSWKTSEDSRVYITRETLEKHKLV